MPDAVRVDNATGKLGVGGLPSGTGAGGTFDLGAAWPGPTVAVPLFVEIGLEPSIPGVINTNFEAITATVVNGSSTATVVQRAVAGTLGTHLAAAIWECGPYSGSFASVAGAMLHARANLR